MLWEIDEAGEHRKTHLFADNVKIKQYCRLDKSRIEVQFPYVLDYEGHILLDIRQQYPEIDPTQFCDYLQDRNGNLWFATTFGLIVVEIRKNHFRRLLYDENAPGGRGYACRGLLEKNGRLLVNLEIPEQGRYRVDPQSGFAERLPGKSAIGIAPAGDGNVWTECIMRDPSWQTLSLFKAGPDGRLIRQHLLQQKDFGFIFAILEESPQRVLLGHINGLTVYNPLDGSAKPWHDARFPEFDKANISWLGKDRSGQVWVCSEQGLFRMRPGGGVAARYWPGGIGEYYLPYNHIYHFYEDQAGVFWLGTNGGGLIRWDRKAPVGHQTRVIYRENGLLNGVVYATYEDKNNHLWLPTDYGIVQLDKTSFLVRHTWLVADGLTHHEFNRTSHCRGADGTLYFGGLNGVTAFHPDSFYQPGNTDRNKRTLAISTYSMLKAGSSQLENCTAEILRSNQITMHPGDRYVQLEFALLEYFSPEKVTYTWKLEGLGTGWESLAEPVLRMSGLPFGTHRLRIRAQAADGALAANELNIELRVLPPFYLRWWFLASAALVLIFSALGAIRWRTQAHRQEQLRLEREVARQTATIQYQNEELKKLDAAKSRFFANISHELRTPLTLVLSPIEQVLKDSGLSKNSQRLLGLASNSGKQLFALINDILYLTKLNVAQEAVQEHPTRLYDFLAETMEAFQLEAERRLIDFQFNYTADSTTTLWLDRSKVLKIINNLLANAMKFTPSGGAVRVQVARQENEWTFTVSDTGPGIHPEDLPFVFDLYFQSKRLETKAEGGIGIGLALSRDLVQRLGGTLDVSSEAGAGALFHLQLPCREARDEAPKPSTGIQKQAAAGNEPLLPLQLPAQPAYPANVLVVEDNLGLQDFLNSVLSDQYQLQIVPDGREALVFLEQCTRLPDLILSDIMMPGLDGFQLLETLRARQQWQHIPVIFLTARANRNDRIRAFRIGVDDYLTKPFSVEELQVRIENALRNLEARREWADLNNDPDPSVPDAPDLWLAQLQALIRQSMTDFQFDVSYLAAGMQVSPKTLYRKVRELTGLSTNQFIQEIRLLEARALLEAKQVRTLRELADAVGFRSGDYLSRLYRERFGKSPADYF